MNYGRHMKTLKTIIRTMIEEFKDRLQECTNVSNRQANENCMRYDKM